MQLKLQEEFFSKAKFNSRLPFKGHCQAGSHLSSVGILSQGERLTVFLIPRAPQLFDLMTPGIIMRTFGIEYTGQDFPKPGGGAQTVGLGRWFMW